MTRSLSLSKRPNGDAAVHVTSVTKVFPTRKGPGVTALDDVSVTVAAGEFVSLIGPSGCGKSTLLRLIADLDQPTSGTVEVFGKSAKQARLDQDYGIAFQSAGLLPWRTVAQNIELPLQLHGVAGRKARVAELIDLVGLTDFASLHPDQLSGGMQQRVAIARSLAESPELLLMDEPFGALDEMTRERMQAELVRICAETKAAVVFVTHSIPEAVFLSDRVVVMSPRPGRIREIVDIRLDAERGELLREEASFFACVTAVREALHSAPSTSSGTEARSGAGRAVAEPVEARSGAEGTGPSTSSGTGRTVAEPVEARLGAEGTGPSTSSGTGHTVAEPVEARLGAEGAGPSTSSGTKARLEAEGAGPSTSSGTEARSGAEGTGPSTSSGTEARSGAESAGPSTSSGTEVSSGTEASSGTHREPPTRVRGVDLR